MDSLKRGFMLDRRSSGATPKTLSWHETALGKFTHFLEEAGVNNNPNAWNTFLLREFIVWLQEQEGRGTEKLSGYSVRTYVNSVWAFCKWLYQEEVLDTDITIRAKKPKLPDTQKSAFTEKELGLLIGAAKNTGYALRDSAIILLLLDTGIRAQELCNLVAGDFHQEETIMVIRQGKGRKDRILPLSVKTAVAISKYLLRSRGADIHPNEPLFVNHHGNELTPSGLLQLIKRIAKKAGVEDAHPHRFRHTSALFFLRNKGDVMTLQRILGHSDLSITRHYLNLLNDDLVKVHASASPVTNLK